MYIPLYISSCELNFETKIFYERSSTLEITWKSYIGIRHELAALTDFWLRTCHLWMALSMSCWNPHLIHNAIHTLSANPVLRMSLQAQFQQVGASCQGTVWYQTIQVPLAESRFWLRERRLWRINIGSGTTRPGLNVKRDFLRKAGLSGCDSETLKTN